MIIDLCPKLSENLCETIGIHKLMIDDKVRMCAFEEAIRESVKGGDIVVDVGAGTGVLSLLSVRAGAKKVYAIERGPLIEVARQLAKANGLAKKIRFLKGDSRTVELPERGDVLISETIGHFGVDEGIVETLEDAAMRFLKASGVIIPRSIRLILALVSDLSAYSQALWTKVGPFNFEVANETSLRRPYIVVPETSSQLMSKPAELIRIEFPNCSVSEIRKTLLFKSHSRGAVHGLIGWFEARLSHSTTLSSNTDSNPTDSWKRVFFPFQRPLKVVAGTNIVVDFRLTLKPFFDVKWSVMKRMHTSQEKNLHNMTVPYEKPGA